MNIATCLVERLNGDLLVFWNKKLKGWALPGGKIEAGETAKDAALRELLEETGVAAQGADLMFAGPTPESEGAHRPRWVSVWRPTLRPEYGCQPRQQEDDCPIGWMSREAFLKCSPVAEFYAGVFAAIGPFKSGETRR